MGTKGRKPESPAARRVRRAAEAPALPAEGPELPERMSGEAEREWGRLVHDLAQLGTLNRADRGILEVAARCYGLWIEAEQRIAAEGPTAVSDLGGLKVSPWLGASKEARRDYLRCLAELGLTPRARGSKPSDGGAEPRKDRLSVFIEEA